MVTIRTSFFSLARRYCWLGASFDATDATDAIGSANGLWLPGIAPQTVLYYLQLSAKTRRAQATSSSPVRPILSVGLHDIQRKIVRVSTACRDKSRSVSAQGWQLHRCPNHKHGLWSARARPLLALTGP